VYPRPVTDRPSFDFHGTMAASGPLSRDQALAALDHAAELMSSSQFHDAARLYQRVIGFDDRGVTAAAMLGFGQAMHLVGEEDQAIGAWQEVVSLPVTPATYPAWRELAAARVRMGDLPAAVEAYRQADRLAPPADKAEIASRLGWLSKELGDSKSAGRYFSLARGGSALAMTIGIISVTTVISLVADLGGSDGNRVLEALQLDKVLVAHGQLYRLVTAALVHASLADNPLHLVFNMYALWIVGPIVERLYGRWRMLAFYIVFAAAGSLMSFALATDPGHFEVIDGARAWVSDQYVVGASGAIFGFFGLVVSAVAIQRPMLGGNMRSLVINLVALIALNLYLGLTSRFVDNWAHVGGLLAGLWFGLLFIPTGVPVLRSLWLRPGAEPGTAEPLLGRAGMLAVRIAGMAGLLVAFVVLWRLGYAAWGQITP
jgi:membrane associated rhomboid family serine protease